jgi:hypothetical protein
MTNRPTDPEISPARVPDEANISLAPAQKPELVGTIVVCWLRPGSAVVACGFITAFEGN